MRATHNFFKPIYIAYFILIVFGSTILVMSVGNHYFFRTTTFDYGTYNYAFWDYSHLHVSPCPIYKVFYSNNKNFLQDHFSLLLMYLVPFYWLINWLTGTYTLMLLQTAFTIWAAWCVYKLVELKTGDSWLGVGALLYYFLLEGHYAAIEEDCNIIIMACCFVPVFLWYFESKRYWIALAVFVLAVFSREDMPLWFAFIFIVVMIWHRKEKKLALTALAYMAASIVVFILTFKVFIPLVQGHNSTYDLFNYTALGENPYQACKFILENPIKAFSLLFLNQLHDPQYDYVKMEFYMVYLVSGGFMLFYRPQYFIWFIPLIAQKMFNDAPLRWSIETYYSVQVVTLLPIPVFIILANEKVKKWRYGLVILICTATGMVTLYDNNHYYRRLGGENISIKRNIFDSVFFKPGYNSAKMHNDLKLIPSDAPVCASTSVLPQLAERDSIYEFPDIENARYIAAFTTPDYYLMTNDQYIKELVYKYLFNPDWSILAYDYPLIVLQKGHNNTSAFLRDSMECNAEQVSADGKYLVGSGGSLFNNDSATISTVRAYSGKHSVKLNKDRPFGMTLVFNKVEAGDFIIATVWRYSQSKDKGFLVVSGGSLYMPVSQAVVKDSAGWEQLQAFCTVPEKHDRMVVYLWNNSDTDVWFDDMVVKRLSARK